MNVKFQCAIAIVACCFCRGALAAVPLQFYTEVSPPGNYLDANGELVGSSVDMVDALNRLTGYEVDYHVVPWTRGLDIVSNTANTALFSTSKTKNRQAMFHWIGPLLQVQWVLYKHRDAAITINSLAEAKNLRAIGANKNDAKSDYLLDQGFTNLDLSEDIMVKMRRLFAGKTDLILSSNLGIYEYARLAKVDPTQLVPAWQLKQVDIYLAFSLGTDQKIISAYQQAYRKLRASSEFYQINERWFGTTVAQSLESLPIP